MINGFDFETVEDAERGIVQMFPRGSAEYERLMARATIRERGDQANRCEIYEDSRCERMATTRVAEPYTPSRIQIQVCDECAAGLISIGYKEVKSELSPKTRALAEDTFARIDGSIAARDAHARKFGE